MQLLDVTRLGHDLLDLALRTVERRVHTLLTGDSRGNRLTDQCADCLEFRNGYKLDTGIRNRVLGRLCRIGGFDGFQHRIREGSCLLVFFIGIGGLARTRRNSNPAFRLTYKLDILFRRRPFQE